MALEEPALDRPWTGTTSVPLYSAKKGRSGGQGGGRGGRQSFTQLVNHPRL